MCTFWLPDNCISQTRMRVPTSRKPGFAARGKRKPTVGSDSVAISENKIQATAQMNGRHLLYKWRRWAAASSEYLTNGDYGQQLHRNLATPPRNNGANATNNAFGPASLATGWAPCMRQLCTANTWLRIRPYVHARWERMAAQSWIAPV